MWRSGKKSRMYSIYEGHVSPYYRSLPLWMSKGVYKFEIKNYKNGDTPILKIK